MAFSHLSNTLLSILLVLVPVLCVSEYDYLEFKNFGYSGTYNPVASLNDIDSSSCSCELGDPVRFSGASAPLNEQVSVHFRGPLILHQFAVYTSPDFVGGKSLSGNWSRIAYYNGEEGVAENATFLTTAGTNSSCLGKALTYAGSDGLSKASSATVLDKNTLIGSNDEYSIFSNLTCGDSSPDGDCGVYRPDIPAYKGYSGSVKMFTFEFEMPTEETASEDISNYNMPAIWLLNAQIPRTAQYSLNANCSCWRSGCGEFDIFEVMNTTESDHLYTTIHDYQGTDDIESGIAIPGYINRDTSGVMSGGALFDSNGDVYVWMSNSTLFNSSVPYSHVNSHYINSDDAVVDTLSSVSFSPASSTSASKKGNAVRANDSLISRLSVGFMGVLFWLL
jgi:hypothetical protein